MNDKFLPFTLPDIGDEELVEIKEVLDSGWLTSGPKVRQFEMEFARSIGASYAVSVNSCTAALHLSLEAMGIESGDEVITTPYTFAASAEVIRYFDATPVFVDICPTDFNINPDLIDKSITKRTRAILPVHIGGLPASLTDIYRIAEHYGLAVVEDAAHAYPSKYRGNFIGQDLLGKSFRHSVCFSFYATKTLTTGEGGMIVTSDKPIADRCRMMSLHGISKGAWKRYTAQGSWYYEILAPGYKYNLSDIAAAIGLAQLRKSDAMWRRRTEIAQQYNNAFIKLPGLEIPQDRSDSLHSWHLYMLRLDLDLLRIDRQEFTEELKRRNIGSSVHFIPLHLHPYYRKVYNFSRESFPVASLEYEREISIPIYSQMTDADVQYVIDSVSEVINNFH